MNWNCGGSTSSKSGCVNFTVDALTPAATITKTAQSTPLTTGGAQRYAFAIANSGNVSLDNFQLNDAIPLNVKMTSIETGVYSGATVPIVIKYKTTASGGAYLTWPFGPYYSNTNTTLNVCEHKSCGDNV